MSLRRRRKGIADYVVVWLLFLDLLDGGLSFEVGRVVLAVEHGVGAWYFVRGQIPLDGVGGVRSDEDARLLDDVDSRLINV